MAKKRPTKKKAKRKKKTNRKVARKKKGRVLTPVKISTPAHQFGVWKIPLNSRVTTWESPILEEARRTDSSDD